MHDFNYSTDGGGPYGHLVIGNDGNFYGVTYWGGTYGYGTIFKITPAGVYTVLHHMNSTPDGGYFRNSLVKGSDGNFYGITYSGGTYNYGAIFRITPAGNFKVLHHMNLHPDGGYSWSTLTEGEDGNFYGVTNSGGENTNNYGTIFKITPSGTFNVIHNMNYSADGGNSRGSLMLNSDGNFLGVASTGGANAYGTIFKLTPAGTLTVLYPFTYATDGGNPWGALVKGSDGNFYGTAANGGANGDGTIFKISLAGKFTNLVNFNGANLGKNPSESLIRGTDGAYYGTTSDGGKYGYGTVFKICGNKITLLHSFNRNAEGGTPMGSLVQAPDGKLYGMTTDGGANGYGTIFKITTGGNYTVLRHFSPAADGGSPEGSLIVGTNGTLYGMTNTGGAGGAGTIFKITTGGNYAVLHSFSNATDGGNPHGSLVEGKDGNFYGATYSFGRIFKITPNGQFNVLHTLAGNDGVNPVGALVQNTNGDFFGVTYQGGANAGGTIFKVTPGGTYTVLKALKPTTDGNYSEGGLVRGNDGNFYGMTAKGGNNKAGTIYKITPAGNFTVLRHLNMATDGGNAVGSFIIEKPNVLAANKQSVSTAEDVPKTITLSGSGGSPLGFNIVVNPRKGTISGTGANRTYTPDANYAGKDSFSFAATFECQTSPPVKVLITVTQVNDTPVLAAIGNKTVVKNTQLKFTANATDVEANQTLTFSLVNAPAGAKINTTSGVFTWTPSTTGSYTLKVRVTDDGNPPLFAERTVKVTVTNTALGTNVAENVTAKIAGPVLYPNPVQNKLTLVMENLPARFNIVIADAKGSIISSQAYQQMRAKNQLEIDVSKLPAGVYFLRLSSGREVKNLRFVK
jgi:uncharacterized repeat protein (TIGR03803 family)